MDLLNNKFIIEFHYMGLKSLLWKDLNLKVLCLYQSIDGASLLLFKDLIETNMIVGNFEAKVSFAPPSVLAEG